jgi:hypothetical protein
MTSIPGALLAGVIDYVLKRQWGRYILKAVELTLMRLFLA